MTFDHLSFLEKPRQSGALSVLGVPIDIGKDGTGTQGIPDYLRQFGLPVILERIGFTVRDLGNIFCSTNGEALLGDTRVKYLASIVPVAEQTAQTVAQAVRQGSRVLALGGDHSMSLGTVAGAAGAVAGEIGLIWIDSHADINTPETTISGNIHGMGASALLGLGHPKLVNVFKPGAKIKKENILFIGLKDLDQAEIDLIRREQLNAITMLDLLRYGFGYVTEQIDQLARRVQHVWVSLDVDAIDKAYAPATLMATPGGLTYREVTNIAKYIGKTCPVIGCDIAELVTQNIGQPTVHLVMELITNFFGSEYGWYAHYMDEQVKKQMVPALDVHTHT